MKHWTYEGSTQSSAHRDPLLGQMSSMSASSTSSVTSGRNSSRRTRLAKDIFNLCADVGAICSREELEQILEYATQEDRQSHIFILYHVLLQVVNTAKEGVKFNDMLMAKHVKLKERKKNPKEKQHNRTNSQNSSGNSSISSNKDRSSSQPQSSSLVRQLSTSKILNTNVFSSPSIVTPPSIESQESQSIVTQFPPIAPQTTVGTPSPKKLEQLCFNNTLDTDSDDSFESFVSEFDDTMDREKDLREFEEQIEQARSFRRQYQAPFQSSQKQIGQNINISRHDSIPYMNERLRHPAMTYQPILQQSQHYFEESLQKHYSQPLMDRSYTDGLNHLSHRVNNHKNAPLQTIKKKLQIAEEFMRQYKERENTSVVVQRNIQPLKIDTKVPLVTGTMSNVSPHDKKDYKYTLLSRLGEKGKRNFT
jgi:hypothetical protein